MHILCRLTGKKCIIYENTTVRKDVLLLDFFTFPSPGESMVYGYIIILIVFIAATLTLRRLKKANEKQIKEDNERRAADDSDQH